jgi:hypothetical protein
MKREDDEQLWDLLGRAAAPKPSPFFARNLLRKIRQQPRWLSFAWNWLNPRRLVPLSGVALVALVGALLITHNPSFRQQSGDKELDLLTRIDPQDYEVVADLDDLVASDENSLWDDDTTSL